MHWAFIVMSQLLAPVLIGRVAASGECGGDDGLPGSRVTALARGAMDTGTSRARASPIAETTAPTVCSAAAPTL